MDFLPVLVLGFICKNTKLNEVLSLVSVIRIFPAKNGFADVVAVGKEPRGCFNQMGVG